jgi:hypothetical protein
VWRAILSGPTGRRQLYDILTVSGALRRRYGREGVDDATRWMGAGQQQLGFDLFLHWLRVDEAAVLKMLRENHPELQKPPQKPKESEDEDELPYWLAGDDDVQ